MIQEHFLKHGWVVIDFKETRLLTDVREALQAKCSELMGRKVFLEQYHELMRDDARHTEMQVAMTQFYREQRFGRKIIASGLETFVSLLGPDILVEREPYLRMTRPHKPQDNIGYHRDTYYGGSPYELSVLIPFVTLPPECSLGVVSGSHTKSEDTYPTKQIISENVERGSPKHKIGFLYAPKVMDASIEKEITQIPLKFGQALIFSLSLVHGSVVNLGKITRWSNDIRIVNAFAPLPNRVHQPHYYEILSQSVVTQAAKEYFSHDEAVSVASRS